MMKVIVLVILVNYATATIPDYIPVEYHELIETLRGICIPKNGITEAMVDAYVIADDSPNMKCYMKCMMLEAKWMSASGEIEYDKIIAQIHPDIEHIAVPLLEKCRVIDDGPHECDKAYNFNVCIAKADPKHYFLP